MFNTFLAVLLLKLHLTYFVLCNIIILLLYLYFMGSSPCCVLKGGNKVSEIRVKDNESLDSALRRFKRSCAKSGIISEIRKREHYEKPSVKRKKKSEAARKRKFK